MSLLLTAGVQVTSGLRHDMPGLLLMGAVLLGIAVGYALAPVFRRNALLFPVAALFLLGLSCVTFSTYQPGLDLANLAGGVALLWIDLDENWPHWRQQLKQTRALSRLQTFRRPVAGG